MSANLLTTTDVATALSLDLRRAQQLVAAHPRARKLGRDWTLPADALAELRERSTARGWPKGRPRKTSEVVD